MRSTPPHGRAPSESGADRVSVQPLVAWALLCDTLAVVLRDSTFPIAAFVTVGAVIAFFAVLRRREAS